MCVTIKFNTFNREVLKQLDKADKKEDNLITKEGIENILASQPEIINSLNTEEQNLVTQLKNGSATSIIKLVENKPDINNKSISLNEAKNILKEYIFLLYQSAELNNNGNKAQALEIYKNADSKLNDYKNIRNNSGELDKIIEFEKEIFTTKADGSIDFDSIREDQDFSKVFEKETQIPKEVERFNTAISNLNKSEENLKSKTKPDKNDSNVLERLNYNKILVYNTGKIELLKNQISELSKSGKSNTDEFKQLVEQKTHLEKQIAISRVSQANDYLSKGWNNSAIGLLDGNGYTDIIDEKGKNKFDYDNNAKVGNINNLISNAPELKPHIQNLYSQIYTKQADKIVGENSKNSYWTNKSSYQKAINSYNDLEKSFEKDPKNQYASYMSKLELYEKSGLFSEINKLQFQKAELLGQKQMRLSLLNNGIKNSSISSNLPANIQRLQSERDDKFHKEQEAEINKLDIPIAEIDAKINKIRQEQNKVLSEVNKLNIPEHQKYQTEMLFHQKSRNQNALIKSCESYLKSLDTPEAQKDLGKDINSKKAEISMIIASNMTDDGKNISKGIEYISSFKKKEGNNISDLDRSKLEVLEASFWMRTGNPSDLDYAKKLLDITINTTSRNNSNESKELNASAKMTMSQIYYTKALNSDNESDKIKNLKEADLFSDKTIQANPQMKSQVLNNKANMYLMLDQPEKAFEIYNQVLREEPNSKESNNIKNVFKEYIKEGKNQIEFSDLSVMKKTVSALQQALKESGNNPIEVSASLYAIGAIVGTCILPGVGTAVGMGVATLIDRAIGVYQGKDKIAQSYRTGYENVSALENVLNTVGLALDFVDVIPVGVFVGKAGRTIGKEVLEDMLSKNIQENVSKQLNKTSSKILNESTEATTNMLNKLDNPLFNNSQLLASGLMLGTPIISSYTQLKEQLNSGKIDQEQYNNQLSQINKSALQGLASLGIFMGGIKGSTFIGDKLNNLSKSLKDNAIHIENNKINIPNVNNISINDN